MSLRSAPAVRYPNFDAGHVGSEGAAVIAGADLQRATPVGGEVRDYSDVVTNAGERREDVGEFGGQRTPSSGGSIQLRMSMPLGR